MPDKRKQKPMQGMSRRRFLQVGIATVTIGIAARWATLFEKSTSEVVNCSFAWAANMTRINERSSAFVQAALLADGLNPTRAEVYDRAMEHKTCYDAEGNVLSSELLFRDNERALLVFTVGAFAMNQDSHTVLLANVIDTLARIDAFRVQDVEVQVHNGEDTLIWQAPFYAAQTASADTIYALGLEAN